MEIDKAILSQHKQLSCDSCVPMSVELVLKLLRRLAPDEYPLQSTFDNRTNPSFAEYEGKTIQDVTFKHLFDNDTCPRVPSFPLDKLFHAIEQEIFSDRYVIVSLDSSGGNWHMYVVHSVNPTTNDFNAVSKAYPDSNLEISDVKERIKVMPGTDILTYSIKL